jgi:hypothetical protein
MKKFEHEMNECAILSAPDRLHLSPLLELFDRANLDLGFLTKCDHYRQILVVRLPPSDENADTSLEYNEIFTSRGNMSIEIEI